MDFTLKTYRQLLLALAATGHTFQTFCAYLTRPSFQSKPKNEPAGTVILRHDIDSIPQRALRMALIEADLGISGTYYFRMTREVFDRQIIQEIANMGHEIGYHYEDFCAAKGNWDVAITHFRKNLEKLRTIYPVTTISMHGSPLSKYDNRTLWEKYDYRDLGIIGESYIDIDFSNTLYLTDTGRRWDGHRITIRDKVTWDTKAESNDGKHESNHPNHHKHVYTYKKSRLKSTYDIIGAAKNGFLPDKMMITIHPQRWNDKFLPWLHELVMQNLKNIVKLYFIKSKAKEIWE